MKLPRYVDRQFIGSLLSTAAFYASLLVILVSAFGPSLAPRLLQQQAQAGDREDKVVTDALERMVEQQERDQAASREREKEWKAKQGKKEEKGEEKTPAKAPKKKGGEK